MPDTRSLSRPQGPRAPDIRQDCLDLSSGMVVESVRKAGALMPTSCFTGKPPGIFSHVPKFTRVQSADELAAKEEGAVLHSWPGRPEDLGVHVTHL